ncbi:MAG: sigma-70 family RNA polymerase sigma factor [Acidobacteriota bacterium]
MTSMPTDVTDMLIKWSNGDQSVHADLMTVIYDELRKRAKQYLARERPGNTLQATALVHEVYLRLIKQNQVRWQNRAHFFGVAAQMMRRILVDHARSRQAEKRGGDGYRLSIDEALEIPKQQDVQLIALDDALITLTQLDPRQSQIVELRFFGGLSVEETAEVLNISPVTVTREWRLAKMWLYRQLNRAEAEESSKQQQLD